VKQVAIFGAEGQLGIELKAEFLKRGCDVEGFGRHHADITDSAAVESLIARIRPECVLNAAAYNKVDDAEKQPETAFQVNALAVRNLATACKQVGAQLVHFSTDYVFDGEAGRPYVEEDETHPLGAYAVSKLAGELYARVYLESALVIRTASVYGPAGQYTKHGNFVEAMLRKAATREPIRLLTDLAVSPTFAPALASRTADLVERNATGVFHLSGSEAISPYEWGVRIFDAAGLNVELHRTNANGYRTPARRPRYSALSNAKAEHLGVPRMPSLDDCLRSYMEARAKRGAVV
jgi:dTDP-4-dehydrorhamnose reductase